MADVASFINKIKGRISGTLYGEPADVNSSPSATDLYAAQSDPGDGQGVLGVLSKLASVRGKGRMAELGAAKGEQERQLDMRDKESLIGSRATQATYMQNLIKKMGYDIENETEDRAQEGALKELELAERQSAPQAQTPPIKFPKGELEDTSGFDGSQVGFQDTKAPREAMQIPLKGGRSASVTPRWREQILEEALSTLRGQEEIKSEFDSAVVGPGSMQTRGGSPVAVNPMRSTTQTRPTEREEAMRIISEQHPEWNEEQVLRAVVNLGDNPAADKAARLSVRKVRGADGKTYEEVYEMNPGVKWESVPTGTQESREQARNTALSTVTVVKSISDDVIKYQGPIQKALGTMENEAQVFNLFPVYRTYVSARKALAGALAVAQQGSRPSDADILQIWLPLIPDAINDDTRSAQMKWNVISVLTDNELLRPGERVIKSDITSGRLVAAVMDENGNIQSTRQIQLPTSMGNYEDTGGRRRAPIRRQ